MRITVHTDENLQTFRHHFLHQTSPETRFGQVALGAIGDQVERIPHIGRLPQPDFYPSDVCLVQDIRGGNFQYDRITHFGGNFDGFIGCVCKLGRGDAQVIRLEDRACFRVPDGNPAFFERLVDRCADAIAIDIKGLEGW